MKTSYGRATTFIVLALVTGTCAAQVGTSLPGKTTASPELERDTLFMVMGMDRAEDSECGVRKIVNRTVITADPQKAAEDWVIDRCGTLVRYRITYTPAPDGGTTFGVFPGQVVGKAEPDVAASAPTKTGFDEAVAAFARGDYATAYREFRPLAEQGDGWAQGFLGVMYADGQGVAQDNVQAYRWYARAAANAPPGELRDTAAHDRDDLARKMTPAQIAQAEELARNFQPRH